MLLEIMMPMWQWIMENRLEMQRIAKSIWNYHIPH